MTAEEYANKRVNDKDDSSYSQHVKNKINMFDGYDLHDAFEAGQDEMKKKAADAFCKAIDGYMIIGGEDYSPVLLDRFKELLNKEQ